VDVTILTKDRFYHAMLGDLRVKNILLMLILSAVNNLQKSRQRSSLARVTNQTFLFAKFHDDYSVNVDKCLTRHSNSCKYVSK